MDSVPVEQQETVQGELGLGTLAVLIRKLHEERRTGTLHIRASGSERRVHFQWGAVVFAGSDRIEDRLDQLLHAEGLVDSATLQQARQAQESSGKRFGECLIDLEALSEGEVLAAVERQVRSNVTFLFSLDRGQCRFEETEDPVERDLALDLPMRDIIVDGIRSMEDPIALQIGVGAMTDYLQAGLTSESANVNAAEGFVLSRVDGRTNILDILSVSPLGEVETLRSICALLAIGVVEAKAEPLEVHKPIPETPPAPLLTVPPPRVAETEPADARAPESHKETSAEDKRKAAEQRYQEGRRLFSRRKYHEAIGALMKAVRSTVPKRRTISFWAKHTRATRSGEARPSSTSNRPRVSTNTTTKRTTCSERSTSRKVASRKRGPRSRKFYRSRPITSGRDKSFKSRAWCRG